MKTVRELLGDLPRYPGARTPVVLDLRTLPTIVPVGARRTWPCPCDGRTCNYCR